MAIIARNIPNMNPIVLISVRAPLGLWQFKDNVKNEVSLNDKSKKTKTASTTSTSNLNDFLVASMHEWSFCVRRSY